MKGKTTNQIETLDVNKSIKEIITHYEIEAQDISYKIEEEIKKAITSLYDQCKMDSLERLPLPTAYANMTKFFRRFLDVRRGFEGLISFQQPNGSVNVNAIFDVDFLILSVLDEHECHPRNIPIGCWLGSINLSPIALNFEKPNPSKVIEGWLDKCKLFLNDTKISYLHTMKIRSLIIRINKLKKGLGRLKKLYDIKVRIDNVDKVFQP